ncbi:ATP-binding protein [Bacillus sp. JJ1764]|uniref:ATP-binding protein n=1 Tax=Bacillus sp. JJ1764 TaxID=3122964 RepID=UPI003000353A
MCKQKLIDLPIYRKILFFSFFITFILVVSTAGFSFFYETNQLTNQLTDRAKGIAGLWSTTIPLEEVKKVKETRNPDIPEADHLNYLVNLIQKKNSKYIGGYILDVEKVDKDKLTFLATNDSDVYLGIKPFSKYNVGPEFLYAFNKAVSEKKTVSTQLYEDEFGTWITSIQPLIDENGKVIAVLAVDVDATFINHFKKKSSIYLFIALITITMIMFFTLRWGLRKFLQPLNEIISGINAVSSGDFNVKVKIPDYSDLGKLGDRFNQMTSQLAVLFERLSDTYKEFGTNPSRDQNVHQVEKAIDEMEKIIEKTRLQKELQRAEKMNAIGQLAASVAHEIRNPMTVVRGFLQIFLSKENLSEIELTYIKLMIEELNRAEKIINEYLSLAKPDLERVEQVDAKDLTKKVADLMNTFAFMSKNISLNTHLEDGIMIKGNQSELKQVVINIVKNGIESMRDGGVLSLSVYKNEEFGIIEVNDTGIGMSEAELARLGTAFYSLKEKGTGMGLMVCYQIVARMKGKIEVESEKGKGTTFKVYIPLW